MTGDTRNLHVITQRSSHLNGLRIRSLITREKGPYNLTVVPGNCTCITGSSGSGKSLLLRAIADLDPHQGEVFLDGKSAADFKPSAWRRSVGLLPAESRWWKDQVDDHFPTIDAELLRKVGFSLDVTGWQINRLSTGERQRLALARLLLNKPKALLLDEPTASLDPDNVVRIEGLIEDYRKTYMTPVVWISHDMEQVKRVADSHYLMTPGGLIENGSEQNSA